jgi:hypothetical protein
MLVEELKNLFLIAYLIFVVWSLLKWARHRTVTRSPIRSRVGSIGLIAGSISAGLFAWFYIYLWVAHKLPVHGLDLWELTLIGEGLALAGFIAGALGSGWVRQSTLFICIVPIFQWLRELVGGVRRSRLVDLAMFAALALFGCALVGYRYLTRDARQL